VISKELVKQESETLSGGSVTSRALTRYTAQEAKPKEENAERPTLNIQRPMKKKTGRRGWDYPELRFGFSSRASLLTLARNAPHRSNCVRISKWQTQSVMLARDWMIS
jgi:hypothetical protein